MPSYAQARVSEALDLIHAAAYNCGVLRPGDLYHAHKRRTNFSSSFWVSSSLLAAFLPPSAVSRVGMSELENIYGGFFVGLVLNAMYVKFLRSAPTAVPCASVGTDDPSLCDHRSFPPFESLPARYSFHGFTTVQIWLYYRTYTNDRICAKLVVGFLWLLQTFQVSLVGHFGVLMSHSSWKVPVGTDSVMF
ncbi:uncharacterized protein EI90DRAFT_1174143 [Cantharellus anzutake]|uniref:uncharacterized protein n=1 Tax=Cantharellus anzutake TaxID=1750568 RepID=UPI0019062D38|nr:uncharacterized protein EI90DRAFT_1174143 [Cantharellus anzutake]KAF8330301.1 hypothetical protein EI90DRAFT_1174143 [Cantharellus anzutake]